MMSTNEKTGRAASVSPIREGEHRPESPTTAQPLDFDDDLDAETPTKPKIEDAPKPPPKDQTAPAKPPRPLSAREQAENTLKEAFPTIDASIVKAVLAASGGQVEPAFNALLGMTDPEAAREQQQQQQQQEEQPPARPPRPQRNVQVPQNQMEADEQYARQLSEHYANRDRSRQDQHGYNENLQGSRIGRPGNVPNPDEPVKWRSFIDDDLPEIRDTIKKGFFDTQQTVNKWITNFKKQLDGDEEEEQYGQQQSRPAQQQPPTQSYRGGLRNSNDMRRSADYARYDADPQVIGDDFSKLELRDGEHPPRTSSRPAASPNLFRASSESARKASPGGRKVSFQEGPPEEIGDMYNSPPKTASTVEASITTKASKWQPLAKVEPSPVAEHDPFSLGDSDDDKDAKPITMKADDDARLKKATSEAMEDSISGNATKAAVKK